MGFKRFFSKIGKGALKGVKQVDAVGDAIRSIPFAENMIAFVPFAGPGLKIALDAVDRAERTLAGPGRGEQKMAIAAGFAMRELAAAGIEEKRLKGLLELALLVHKGEAGLAEVSSSEGSSSAPSTTNETAAAPKKGRGKKGGKDAKKS